MYEAEHEEMQEAIYTKIVGVSFEGRQELIKTLKEDDILELRREPGNQYDKNAIAVLKEVGEWYATHVKQYKQLGYISRELAVDLAEAIDRGMEYGCKISSVTGGQDGRNFGINIEIRRR